VGVILDTCTWIDRLARRLSWEAVAAATGPLPVYLSVISLGELRFGAEVAADPALRAKRMAQLRKLERRPLLPISSDTAAAFGVIAAAVKYAGRSPRPRFNDLWIAAQAIEHGYALLTHNGDDFAHVPGLRLLALPHAAD
jgi:predicted nucleic acid-binding protein